MTDLPDELRDRLPDADRIRDRIRERRDADEPASDERMLDDDIAGTRDPDAYYKVTFNDLALKGEEDGGGMKAGDTERSVFAKYDGIDGELKAGDTHKVVDHRADDVAWKVEEGESLKLGDDVAHKVVDHKSEDVVDPKADDIAWKVEEGESLKLTDTHKVVDASKVVDHRADDVAWKVEEGESWKVEEGESWKVEEGESLKVGDGKIADVADDLTQPETPSLKWNDITLKADEAPTDQLEIESTASYSEAPVDPVADALAPLDDGDQYQAMPELDASVDAASPMLGDDDGLDGV